MADKKISELPASSALDTNDLIPVVEDGTTVKATISDLLNLDPSDLPEGYSVPAFTQGVADDRRHHDCGDQRTRPRRRGVVLIPGARSTRCC
jgi:hypothetical protein